MKKKIDSYCQQLIDNIKNNNVNEIELRKFLKDLMINNPKGYKSKLRYSMKDIANYLYKKYPQLENHSITEYCIWFINDLKDFPKCPSCGKNIHGFSHNGYFAHCSKSCINKDNAVKQKIQKTIFQKTGCNYYFQTKSFKEQSKKTLKEKTGYEYSFQNPATRQKAENTCMEKYGVKNGGYSKIAKEKQQKIWLEHYGVDHPWKSNIVKEKNKKTIFKKYGVNSILELSSMHQKRNDQISKESYDNFILNNEYDEPYFTFEEYKNRNTNRDLLKFKCKKCGNIFESIHYSGYHLKCPLCYPKTIGFSDEEKDLTCFIKQYVKIEENVRNIIHPYELDIYISEKKLAIEFDGLFWHSESQQIDKKYHLNKTELCEKQGIHLIHIFENEWLYKQDIVKSRIKNLLGIYDKIVFARKCEIKEIDSKISNEFQENNHIQGVVNAKVNLGLFYNDELISVMTFGKTRFSKKYEWELLRFCNKLGYHIPGAAGKLLKYFEKTYQPNSLVSYADRRWSMNSYQIVYYKLGFKLDHISNPDYWYWKNGVIELESRVKYQKHKLKNLLENFDKSKSEVENMKNNSYNRIFDCGNLVFVKEYV